MKTRSYSGSEEDRRIKEAMAAGYAQGVEVTEARAIRRIEELEHKLRIKIGTRIDLMRRIVKMEDVIYGLKANNKSLRMAIVDKINRLVECRAMLKDAIDTLEFFSKGIPFAEKLLLRLKAK